MLPTVAKDRMMKPIAEQIILVTGATDGLGKATALALAEMGATVLLHGRDEGRLDTARQDILAAVPAARLETYRSNFAALADVRRFGERLQSEQPRIDTLINNAAAGGGKPGDPKRELSQD